MRLGDDDRGYDVLVDRGHNVLQILMKAQIC
jgi:hypothetical protein